MQVDKLEIALTLIPPEDRMILQMKYQDDVPIKELQEVLDQRAPLRCGCQGQKQK
jgi:RNA polymerase sigma-70 factor (ECF subfamily)